ncbi:MAG: outer membrane protein assembly factor BamC [Gammaproteobacteria bacterium]|nr:outer membrane protein assembly factor BamC [Gammaproteobacteria bacterium]
MKYSLGLVGITALSVLSLSGCSSLSKSFGSGDAITNKDNYRVTQDALISPLELPPGFQNPNRSMDLSNRQLMGQLNDKIMRKDIPTYQVDGLSIRSNLSERWLHVDKVNPDDLWERLQRFLVAQGFTVEESRKDVGLIRTAYVARKEVVPKSEMSFLTRILNSWREETAKGAMDRLTLRVETDKQGGANVYLRHSMIFSDFDGDINNWRLRPYQPLFEAEMLYQSMVFLGASMNNAVAQVAATEKRLEMSLDGEFAGLSLKAGMEESWQFILSLADRSGFTVLNTDKANGVMTLKLKSDATQEEKGFFSRLFSSEPEAVNQVSLKFKANSSLKTTDVIVESADNRVLTANERRSIFQRMGAIE